MSVAVAVAAAGMAAVAVAAVGMAAAVGLTAVVEVAAAESH